MKYFVLILAFVFLGFSLLGTNTSYSQTDSFDEMSYLQFLDFCHRYNPALWDSMSIEERLLSNLCDFVGKGFGEKQWTWLNGAKLDWESFAKNASENYAEKIPEFIDGGIKETLRVDSFVSGRDSFPPPMMAMISFDYEKLSQVIHYDEKFTICIDGKLVPQDSFIECSDEYVKYDFTKEEPFSVPKFAKNISLPEHTRQQMSDWCQNSPKWAKIDKQFWDVIPVRLVSNTDEFQSLHGIKDSFVINSNAGHDTCPPTMWASGTFASDDGKSHRFALEYNADFFRYTIDEIHCKDGLTVVTKSSDGSSACVKPETKQKLIERGWAVGLEDAKPERVDISAIKYRYSQVVNEPISDFYVKIEGTGYNYYPPELWISDTKNNTVWANSNLTYLGGGRPVPGDFCKEYRFYDIGGPVILNDTGVYTMHMSFEGRTASYQLAVKEKQPENNYPTYGNHCEATLSEQVNGYDNFILTIINQSEDRDPVGILVQIDDDVTIDSSFEAKSKHEYGFLLTEGNHTIAAATRGEHAILMQDFVISGKWLGHLSYWHDDKNSPHFEMVTDDKEFS